MEKEKDEDHNHVGQVILKAPKPMFKNNGTWWMVDLKSILPLTQGATPLMTRCMKEYEWNESLARQVLKAYRQYLHLVKVCEDWDSTKLLPPKQVKKMWKEHVLDTRNYISDCVLLTGNVVHHAETDRASNKAERVEFTKEALKEHFADADINWKIWAGASANASPQSTSV